MFAGTTAGRRRGAGLPGLWRTAVVPWVVGRVVVLGALAAARELSARGVLAPAAAQRVRQGLLGWDAGWYLAIARHGYSGAGHSSLRFFPLVPAAAHVLAMIPGLRPAAALVVLSNGAALGATALLAALARHESGDEALARRVAWLSCLAPPAFTFVMGYAESTLVALAAGALLAARRRRWSWAGGLGLLAGLARPLGVLVAVPLAVEAARGLQRARGGARVSRAVAVLGPVVGTGGYLAWVGWRYGDALAPLSIQETAGHRGSWSDPLSTLAHDASLLVHGQHLGQAMHLPWVLLALGLLAVAVVRWPGSYAAFAAAVLAAALTAANLDGFERYAFSAFPLVLAGGTVTAGARMERAVLALAAAGLVAYAVLAFTNVYVP